MPRPLARRGLYTYYADESDDKTDFVMATVRIPTLHLLRERPYIYWDDFFEAAKSWRKRLKDEFGVPIKKELKGSSIATGHNNYLNGVSRIYGRSAYELYKFSLQTLTFLPKESVFSVFVQRGYQLYGHTRLEAALYALFQRMQRQCEGLGNALVFFDEGHAEYRSLFRRSCRYLPTGSAFGAWEGGRPTSNKPFQAAVKDLNFKDSKQSHFVQIADLVAYATLLKARQEHNRLSPREVDLGFGDIHNFIPRDVLNTRVVKGGNDGIVRLNRNDLPEGRSL